MDNKSSPKGVSDLYLEKYYDPATKTWGMGVSKDNGLTYTLLLNIYGRVYSDDDIKKLWPLLTKRLDGEILNKSSEIVKKEVDSATAEIPKIKSAADKAIKRADDAVAKLNEELNANSSSFAELQSSVSSNQVILDSASKSLSGIANDLSKYAQDAASQGKTIAKLQQDQESVTETISTVQGDVAQLRIDASSVNAVASNNKSEIASLRLSASSALAAIKDANSNAAVATATASQAYVGLQDAKSNIASVQATANGLKETIANAQSDINQVITDAKGMHEQISNANSQVATIDKAVNGLQSTVKDKVDSSTFAQLSNVVQSKVSSDQFNSKYSQLSNMIDARVSKDDLLGEINLQAGSTLIKNKKILLDGETVVFGEKAKAFIPDAAITKVTADKITAGTISGVNLLINNANDITTITNNGVTNAGLAPNVQDRYITTQVNNGVITFSSAKAGKDDDETLTNLTKSATDYSSAIFGNNGDLLESSKGTITLHAGDLLNDKSFWTNEGTQISSSIPEAEIKLKPVVNEKAGGITLTASTSIIDMTEGKLSIFTTVGDSSQGGGVQINGLGMGGATIWSPDNYFAIGSQKTQSYTPVNAQAFHSQSVLSSKTRIKRLDRKEAMSVILRDDIYTYLYKSDVKLGLTKRHASLVIDDENDVKQYRAPEEFITDEGNARDDGTQLGYLIAAVQYQQEEIEELKRKLEEK